MIDRRSLLHGAAFALAGRKNEPELLRSAPENEASVVTVPDGSMRVFYMVRDRHVASIASHDNGRTWSGERVEFVVSSPTAHACVAMVDRGGEIQLFYLAIQGEGRRPGVDRFVDVWHCHTHDKRTAWRTPRRIFEGYIGSLRSATQLRSGRIVLPFAIWQPNRPPGPPFGANDVTALLSDDEGRTWKLSSARLRSPCIDGYNGSNYGAVEPCVTELGNGRLWMLIRTQTGQLYQSFSSDGFEWSDAEPSRFRSSNSPAAFLRLRSGRLIAFWNNCMPPPRYKGDGVYGGRDALHAAISTDRGQGWKGFREVWLDPTRNESPPKRGDRATAYPYAAEAPDGFVVLATGQGAGRRALIRFHPDWLLESGRTDRFAAELEQWSVYESFGPAEGYWRDRRPTASLERWNGRPAMKVSKAAVWNFPAGATGALDVSLIARDGNAILVALTDCFYDPDDDTGDADAVFFTRLKASASDVDKVRLKWDRQTCTIQLGEKTLAVQARREFPHGISYVRLRPDEKDASGFVVVEVSSTVA